MGRWVIKRWVEQAVDGLRKTLALTRNACGAPPVDMSGGRRVSIRMNTGWTINGATIHIGGATFEFDRAP